MPAHPAILREFVLKANTRPNPAFRNLLGAAFFC
jgi:hypothetical protein